MGGILLPSSQLERLLFPALGLFPESASDMHRYPWPILRWDIHQGRERSLNGQYQVDEGVSHSLPSHTMQPSWALHQAALMDRH